MSHCPTVLICMSPLSSFTCSWAPNGFTTRLWGRFLRPPDETQSGRNFPGEHCSSLGPCNLRPGNHRQVPAWHARVILDRLLARHVKGLANGTPACGFADITSQRSKGTGVRTSTFRQGAGWPETKSRGLRNPAPSQGEREDATLHGTALPTHSPVKTPIGEIWSSQAGL